MKYLVCIAGPTAIGKTSLSIALAQHFSTEIISCDSRQFYKEMQIGTAVPSKEELNSVKHHFIQNCSIHDTYNVGQYEKEALHKLDTLFQKYNLVVLVGGSGLYFDAVIKGLDYFPKVAPHIREQLSAQLQKEGIVALQAQLEYLDPKSFQSIDIQNPHRVIRALEICMGTDKPYSYYKNRAKTPRNFTPIKVGLNAERSIIYKRIEQRVDLMIEEGLEEEARKLHPHKHLNALQTVGYRELFDYFDGKTTLDFAISEIKKNTRRFAKRQNTWFKKDMDIQWFDFQTNKKSIIEYIEKNTGLKESS